MSPPGNSRRTGRLLAGAAACLALAAALAAQAAGGTPAAGSCHVRGRGLFVLPDPRCTPGATNPAVSQATIAQTICVPGWSERVRPPESVTEPQKRRELAAYGYYDGRELGRYELDHLIPISLGGATDSLRNLWPEPDYPHVAAGSYDRNPKDRLEYRLYSLVCDRRLSLGAARRQIARDWVASYRRYVAPIRAGAPRPARAWCRVSAAYDRSYGDYDVYVHSDQPDRPVRVTDGHGDHADWHTDAGGYADVYLHVHGRAAGRRLTARVGAATCSTTLGGGG
jgi:hypothetical protein